ncbi:MAG TPA: DMT family transporter [Candidatus Limnocylindria bacterium]|jgi:drug/metabolite transporter (DMT)-like permease|nr:DMT family transporter [Candidatus Limnocylindria bacterium]
MIASVFGALAGRPVMTAVLGAMSIAFSGILVRLAHVEPATAAIFRCAYALPALGLIAYLERRTYGPRPAAQVRIAMLAGVFLALDLVIWHHTIALVGAGLATVLGNTQVVIVAFLAWLILGERPPRRTLLALPIVLVGVVLISGVIGTDPYGTNPGLGVILGIVVGIVYAAFLLVLRRGNSDLRRPAGPLFDATLISALASLVIGLPLGEVDLVPSWPAHAWLLTLALTSQVLGWLIISVSLPRLPAALTSVILTLQPVGSVLLAMVLLGEAPSALQLLGAGTILVGLVLATIRLRGEPQRQPIAEPEIG